MAGKMNGDYNGIQKCAILMIALGPERASKIFAHLKEEEIETLTLEIANTKSVSQQDKDGSKVCKRWQRTYCRLGSLSSRLQR